MYPILDIQYSFSLHRGNKYNKHLLMVMNQNNMTLLVLGLSLAVVVMLAAAQVLNNEEMAYAINTRGGAAGPGGRGGSSS